MEPSLPVGVYQLDARGRVLAHVSVVQGVVGASHALGRNFFEDVAPATDCSAFRGRFEALARRGGGTASFSFRMWDLWRQADVRVQMMGTSRGVWLLIAEPELCARFSEARLSEAAHA